MSWVGTVEQADDPLEVAQETARRQGSFIGMEGEFNAAFGHPEVATLIIGAPRSGKTSGLVVPMLLLHNGPAVVTSTKDELARLTGMARYRRGRVFLFDPSGETDGRALPEQFEMLRWSPLQSARTSLFEATKIAQAMAEATVGRSGASDVKDGSYWAQRATLLLSALFYAATRPAPPELGRQFHMGDVAEWVALSDLLPAMNALEALMNQDDDARRALQQLLNVANAPKDERGSVITTTFAALAAYNSGAAVRTSTDPNFDTAAFVESEGDTIYVTASSEDQRAIAPLIVGLLQDVRRATFAEVASTATTAPRFLEPTFCSCWTR